MNFYMISASYFIYYMIAVYLLSCVPSVGATTFPIKNIDVGSLRKILLIFIIVWVGLVGVAGGEVRHIIGQIFFLVVCLFFVKSFERFVSEKTAEYNALLYKNQNDLASQKKSLEELNKILDDKRKYLDRIVADFSAARQTLVCIDVNELSQNIVKTIMNYPLVSSVVVLDCSGKCLAYSSKDAAQNLLQFKEKYKDDSAANGCENLLIYHFRRQSSSDFSPKNDIIGLCVVEFKKDNVADKRDVSEAKIFLSENVLSVFSLGFSRAVLFEEYDIKSRYDALTGIFNRRYFMEKLAIEINRVRRYGGSFGVVMLDIDHFKKVNDTCGHPTGDRALVLLAKMLSCEITPRCPGMFWGRYGGEEFVGCVPLAGNDEEINLKLLSEIAESIRAETQRKVIHTINNNVNDDTSKQFSITVSIGVSKFPRDGDSLETIIDASDKALYVAKTSGRNRVIFYTKK